MNKALMMAALTALAIPAFESKEQNQRGRGRFNPATFDYDRIPDNRGRRAEKDAAALAKAEAKRARKAAKRLKDASDNAKSTPI